MLTLKRTLGTGRSKTKVATALAVSACLLAASAAGGCYWWDDDYYGVDYAYEYYYPYSYYYPADLAYSSLYWSDTYYYSDWYYADSSATSSRRAGIGSVIRALARSETVCPGQVTVTPKAGTPACAGDANDRSGVTIVFNGCQTLDGGKLDGTIDVQAMRTANEQTCTDNTLITLTHKTTVSNLSYTAANGERVLIPQQVDTGTNSYTYGQLPGSVGIESSGRVQVYGADSKLKADLSHDGTRQVSYLSGNRSYSVSGMVNVQDAVSSGRASLLGSNINRTTDCCHPVGGSLTISRTGGNNPGEHTWTFGPTCGQTSMDGTAVTPSVCL